MTNYMSVICDIFDWINRGVDETHKRQKIEGLIMTADVKKTSQFSEMEFRDRGKKQERVSIRKQK